MSMLAYVLCVLLVATATTATDDVFDIERSTNLVAAVTKTAKNRSEAALETVNEVLSQIKLEKLLDPDTWTSMGKAPSAECFGFLKKRIETQRSLVIECSQSDVEVLNYERERLEKLLTPLLKRFDEHKRFAEFCVSWYSSDDASFISPCIEEVCEDITAMDNRNRDEITEIVLYVKKVANSWVPKAGKCAAYDEGRDAMVDWAKACSET